MKIWVPMDSAAKALGAEEVVTAIRAEAERRGVEIEIARNGTRGMIWLEPLVEASTLAVVRDMLLHPGEQPGMPDEADTVTLF